jgi:excisionase family DNA binding protein
MGVRCLVREDDLAAWILSSRTPTGDRILNRNQCATIARLPNETIIEAIQLGDLATVSVGRKVRVRESDLRKWLEAQPAPVVMRRQHRLPLAGAA